MSRPDDLPAEFQLDPPPDGSVDAPPDGYGPFIVEQVSGLIRQRAELDSALLDERREATHRRRDLYLRLIAIGDALDRILMLTDLSTLDEVAREYVQALRQISVLLEDVLADEDVIPLDQLEGHPFDPTRQEAVRVEARADCAAGTVLEVIDRGYLWGEQVLRPARVVVAQRP